MGNGKFYEIGTSLAETGFMANWVYGKRVDTTVIAQLNPEVITALHQDFIVVESSYRQTLKIIFIFTSRQISYNLIMVSPVTIS